MQDYKYPKIDAKHFHYHNDGTGRDQYVKHTNGGLLSQKMLKSLDLSPRADYTKMIFPKTATNSFDLTTGLMHQLKINCVNKKCLYELRLQIFLEGEKQFNVNIFMPRPQEIQFLKKSYV